MGSIVLNKIVLIDEEDNVCMCSKEFYITCPVRIAGDLPCKENLIRFTSLESETSNFDYDDRINSLDGKLRNEKNSFKETLGHLGRFK